jgi:arsenate reductase-like glutaredoxin family protein
VQIKETINAKSETYGADRALALAKQADRLIVAKGTKVVTLDLKKDNPSDDTILGLILGPTGNLRAPTIRKGKTLLVGFNAEAYKKSLT